jgi:pimeloyl-ACP methyl ester carboxylesterase
VTVAIAGHELECEQIEGAEPALVFLHEGLGSVALWRDFPARLAAASGRRALLYSRAGHGRSDVPDAPRTPRFMHEEALDVLPALLDRFELEAPVLVGHSDGGSIALIYAGTSGRAVSGLIALAPHVFVEDVSVTSIQEARETFATTDLAVRMARYHRDAEATFRLWNDIWLAPEFRDWNIEDALAGVTCPVLVIQGEHDQYGTLAQVEAIERGVAGPVQRALLDCRHAPHLEAPDATLAAAAAFVDGLR